MVAYNAVSTIGSVLERIPADVWPEISEVAVFDDASHDATHELALEHGRSKRLEKLTVVRNPANLGYGGNQKLGYSYFAERGFDIVVLLHGDGQYAPEILRQMYEPIVDGRADAVFGSRMMPGYDGPLKGGMPLYKFVGNRILTRIENAALGVGLTEFHSGYRAYRLDALRALNTESMTDDFHFDTEIIIKLHHHGFRILEVPIPTYYGDEICHVDGVRYARDVVRAVQRYKRTVRGAGSAEEFAEFAPHYPLKPSDHSSHAVAARWVGEGRRVLDVGCGQAFFSEVLAAAGNHVVGVDQLAEPAARTALEDYVRADLDAGLASVRGLLDREGFDTVLLMDVLEHLRWPEELLGECRSFLRPGGTIIVSVPNVANLTVRLALLLGRFEYTERGILDRTHVRHFTRRTVRRMVRDLGYAIVREDVTPVPFEVALGLSPRSRSVRVGGRILKALTRLWPGGLAYQSLLELRDGRLPGAG